ncbi:MAG: hypothetical protein GY739_17880, partial [Mesoflavibacter sp.]|nr:hypothetical protein [Mesoflavibacter sp.]
QLVPHSEKMSSSAARLYAISRKPREQRRQVHYTKADITKDALEKWAAENGKTRAQIHRRKYKIKQCMLLQDAKEAAPPAEAKADSAQTTGDSSGGAAAGAPEDPESPLRCKKRRQRDAGPTKHLAGIPKEKKAKVEAVKRNVCRKLNFDPKHPWDHPEYVNLMIEEYGG